MKMLVVYFSRTGNTKGIAETIATELEADKLRIEDTAKRTGFPGYLQSGLHAAFKKATPIQSIDCNLEQFDLTIVGTPVWCWSLASPVRTFLQEHSSHLKDVAFFCTEGGSGGTSTFREMASLCGKRPLATLEITEADIRSGADKDKLGVFIHTIDQIANQQIAV